MSEAVSAQDPFTILAGIKRFGLAPDGSDLRDLRSAILRIMSQATDDVIEARQLAKREAIEQAAKVVSDYEPWDAIDGNTRAQLAADIRKLTNEGHSDG